jgi:hypothetical protein
VAIKKRLSRLDEARNSGLDEDELQENVWRIEEVWLLWRWGGFWMEDEEGSRRKVMKERLVVTIALALVHFESVSARATTPEPEYAAVNIFYLIFYI